jgi:hypothetical protein
MKPFSPTDPDTDVHVDREPLSTTDPNSIDPFKKWKLKKKNMHISTSQKLSMKLLETLSPKSVTSPKFSGKQNSENELSRRMTHSGMRSFSHGSCVQFCFFPNVFVWKICAQKKNIEIFFLC